MREVISKMLKKPFSVFRQYGTIGVLRTIGELELHDDHPFARVGAADDDVAEQARLLAHVEEREAVPDSIVACRVAYLVVPVM